MAEAEARPIKMKELEERTGVSREAIHFYLREGLLPEPERPKRNVAHYSEDHVRRIRAIKRLQEERFLPLGRIKTILEGAELADSPTGDALEVFEHQTLALVSGHLPTPNRSLQALSSSSGVSENDIRALATAGVIQIQATDGGQTVDFRDASIVELWGRVLELGFERSPAYGPGFLARYAEALGAITEKEVDEFLDAFGDVPTGEAAEMAAQGIELSNEILTRMRTQALLRRLHARTES
jgi:DNA-binding transcriptional MerR regulator